MVVGVYGLLYLHAAWRLETAWPIIAVGLLGKVLGPVGMAASFSDDWPRRLGMICVFNDLIWWFPFAIFLIRGTRLARWLESMAPWVCVATHVTAVGMLAAFLRQGTTAEPDVNIRAGYVASHVGSWSAGWAVWMLAAVTIVGFYSWWGSRLTAWKIAVVAVVLCAFGMACDFSGEGSAILRMSEAALSNLDRFTDIERQFTILSPGIANGLYTLAGILLTTATPNLPGWVRAAMWLTWIAGIAMTVSAFADTTIGIVASTVILFPPLMVWIAWMGARWRHS